MSGLIVLNAPNNSLFQSACTNVESVSMRLCMHVQKRECTHVVVFLRRVMLREMVEKLSLREVGRL